MKKITSLFILLFALLLSNSVTAQMNAVDDLFSISSPGGTTGNIASNDSNGGIPATSIPTIQLTLLTALPSYITFNPVAGTFTAAPGSPIGLTTISYQICETSSPNNCAIGTVSIRVNEYQLTVTGVYSDFNGNSFVDVGDIITYNYLLQNYSTTPFPGIIINALTGAYGLTSLAPLGINTLFGIHTLNAGDINNGYVINEAAANTIFASDFSIFTLTTPLAISDALKLNAFQDLNSDGIQNAGEPNFSHGTFNYSINSGPINNVVNPTGMVNLYESNPGNTYDISYTVDPAYSSVVSTTTSYSSVTVPSGSGVTTKNFPITIIPYNDLQVVINHTHGPVPGLTYANRITVFNNGTAPIIGETITYTTDPNLSIIGYETSLAGFTFIVPTVTTANSFSYTIPTGTPLASGDYIQFYVYLQTPTLGIVNLGDLLTNSATVSMPSADVIPSNNTFSITQDVRGAYDPNDINELHGEKILFSSFTSSDYLTYTIRFENTGTGNAININIDTVLDAKLNPSTIRIIDSSAPYTLDRIGNNLSFKFAGIDLPPSVSDASPVGKGYITYQIKPTAGYAIGDIIPNTANIYFDTNPAIITNTFNTEFVNTLAVQNFENSSIKIFPNPTSNILNIQSESIVDSIELIDLNGRSIETYSPNAKETLLNLEKVASGMYLVKVTTEKGTSVQKVIKQ